MRATARSIGLGLPALIVLIWGSAGISGVAAQTYPAKPIKLILPFGIGSPPDALGRLVANCLSNEFNQGVVVENRPGAGSTIATRAAAAAPADGYTLLQVNSAFAYASALYPNAGYDPIGSFTPVAALASWSLMLVVNGKLPVDTVQELIEYAKAHPGGIHFGHTLGSPPQVLAEMFRKASGAPFNTVAYRQTPQLTADLLSGQIHAFFGGGASLTALVNQRKLKVLATTAPVRTEIAPQIPSIVESGFPLLAFDPTDWTGLVTPAGTSSAVVAALNTAINDCLKAPDVRANIVQQGAQAKAQTPTEFSVFIADEVRKWPPRVRDAGLKAE